MAKGKPKLKNSEAVEVDMHEGDALDVALGDVASDIRDIRLRELVGAALFLSNDTEEVKLSKMNSAIESLKSFAPVGEMERLLVSQMIGTHGAAMECLRRAMYSEQSFEGRDMNLKHAEKLMSIYAKQVDTLNKHRGKGQQKITVQHVNVEAGGQAIVGNVDGKKAASERGNQMLTDDKEAPIDITPSKKRSKPKSRK